MATSRIFVKGLPTSLTEAEFRKHFSAGNREVTDVKLMAQRRIGYVGYKSADDAAKAVKYFNKTYIRMSKIAVEPARAISDSAPTKAKFATRTAAPEKGNRALPPTATSEDGGSKKRKREDLDQSDPKLQEYLRVMGSGRESLVADETAVESSGALAPQGGALVPDGESDDEYVEVPSRKEKVRKVDHATGETGVAQVTPARETASRKEAVSLPADGGVAGALPGTSAPESEAANQPADVATAATDDDWLRSRTSRLLDLVDPDDISHVAPMEKPDGDSSTGQEVGNDKEAPHSEEDGTHDHQAPLLTQGQDKESAAEAISRTSRLFVRNLPYSATEDDLREELEKFGGVDEVHMPINAQGTGKGFALVLFTKPSDAVAAFQALDGATFQGRIVHIIPADAKREHGVDDFSMSGLPLKKQNLIRRKKEAASTTFNWNSLYMSQDAVNASVAARLGVSKSEVLDPTSADAAVKQAIAETSVIQETKAYFAANGVDLDAFKSHKRGDLAILVKNFPYGTTMEELRKMFEEFGPVVRVLMPPTGTIAIVQFAQANHAKSAFGKLAYRRIKDSVLFLEKAPKDLFTSEAPAVAVAKASSQPTGTTKLSVSDLLTGGGDKAGEEEVETTSLFVRNLNFSTTTSRLAEAFKALDGFVSARVKTKTDPKKPGQILSMGFGFVEFRTKAQAQAALGAMDGHVLDDHALAVKASHKGNDAAEERRKQDKAKKVAAQRTKVVIKNLPFQATKQEVRTLFGSYGQLRSVRVPKKTDGTSRGFAFADFVTPREAENALNALRDTHLLGRRLVMDFAEAEAVDAEEEIEKMQHKVGGQVNKVALQQLTGGGRKKVNIGNEGEDEMDLMD
ncbi:Nucleotide-binding, alpha-beta plait [Cordyceps fumosorosea ARSEF 2679]|uniref:Multiple RNA-binding domain-containing protein 1 n=1 Tax=Cordyceps fumosorosea (strain ARSEF 2679) TaxID=1081104 RepID=A0A162JVH2_CORFA|nr:Nucleotide-binding, alpha-beta plait [Cordyceps fumosorosea ARSEF 2679]OAA49708.1 Nucleotide-binding, alpha-beta plait [Cordyceps fumosorosea ARSEF 2679]